MGKLSIFKPRIFMHSLVVGRSCVRSKKEEEEEEVEEEGERGRSKRQSGRELGVGQEEDESWEGDDSWQAFQGLA